MSSNTKNLIILGVLVAATFLVYFFFLRNPSSDAGLITESGTPTADTTTDSQSDEGFIAVLLNVRNIKLDDSIFSDPAFKSLHNTPIDLTPEAGGGRPNPFAPLGTDNANTTTTSTAPAVSTTSTPASLPPSAVPTTPAMSPTLPPTNPTR